MPHVIVECVYEPPASPEAIRADVDKVRQCLVVREVEIVAVYVADNGRRALHLLRARDAESARNGFRSAGVAFERAWSATALTPCAP